MKTLISYLLVCFLLAYSNYCFAQLNVPTSDIRRVDVNPLSIGRNTNLTQTEIDNARATFNLVVQAYVNFLSQIQSSRAIQAGNEVVAVPTLPNGNVIVLPKGAFFGETPGQIQRSTSLFSLYLRDPASFSSLDFRNLTTVLQLTELADRVRNIQNTLTNIQLIEQYISANANIIFRNEVIEGTFTTLGNILSGTSISYTPPAGTNGPGGIFSGKDLGNQIANFKFAELVEETRIQQGFVNLAQLQQSLVNDSNKIAQVASDLGFQAGVVNYRLGNQIQFTPYNESRIIFGINDAELKINLPGGIGDTNNLINVNPTSTAIVAYGNQAIPFQPGLDNAEDGFVFSLASNTDINFFNDAILTGEFGSLSGNGINLNEISFNNNLSLSDFAFKDDPSGVDFSNVEVAAINVDDATKVVNFILKGTRIADNTSPSSTLRSETKLLKKVFLQALAIPNNRQLVSLEVVNGSPKAIADANFKKTNIAPIFFKADADMKKDLANFLLGKGPYESRTSYIEGWVKHLSGRNRSKLISLTNRYGGKILPKPIFRGVIFPVTPSGGKDNSQVFINNASYKLDIDILNPQTDFFREMPQGADRDFLLSEWNTYKSRFFSMLIEAETSITNRINNKATGNYKNLKKILSPIIAAHWYKQAPTAVRKEFNNLINSSNLSSSSTGINFSETFDQNFYDGLAHQVLVNLNFRFTTEGLLFVGNISMEGGLEVNSLNIAGLGGNAQPSIINTTKNDENARVANNLTTDGNDEFIFAGTTEYKLPEIMISSFSFTNDGGQVRKDKPVEYEFGSVVNFTAIVTNLGNKDANNIPLDLLVKEPGASTFKKIKLKSIKKLSPGRISILKAYLHPAIAGDYTIKIVADGTNTINEVVEDVSNSYTRKFRVLNKLYCNKDIDLSTVEYRLNEKININSRSCKIGNGTGSKKFIVMSQGSVNIHATETIQLQPGVKFEPGSRVNMFISDCSEAKRRFGLNRTQKLLDSKIRGNQYVVDVDVLFPEGKLSNETKGETEDFVRIRNMMFKEVPKFGVNGDYGKAHGQIGNFKDRKENVSINPNPTHKDFLNFYYGDLNISEKFSLIIFDYSGKMVKTIDIGNTEIDSEKMIINIQSLHPGMYILKYNGISKASAIFIKN